MAERSASSKQPTNAFAALGPAMSAMAPAGTGQWIEFMTESGRFIVRRLEEDLKAQQAFLGCKTPAEVMQVQTGYYKKAVEQYSAEAGRIFEIMSSGVTSGPYVSSKSMLSRGYDDIPV